MSNKDLFQMMREQEVQTQNFLPNKKEIQFSATKFITDVIDGGEVDKYELLAQAKRINKLSRSYSNCTPWCRAICAHVSNKF